MKGLKKGNVALVTGGSSGLGEAVAFAFAREDVKVVIADIDEVGGITNVNKIKENGGEAMFFKTDISKNDEVKKLIEGIIDIYGRLDYANNNAGIGEPKRVKLAKVSEGDFDKVLSVNLKGVWLCMKYEIAQMKKQRKGAIVNTSSVCGLVGSIPLLSSYVTSKHGVIGMTKAAAMDYATEGIRINAVCPGTVLTPQLKEVTRDNPKEIEWQASLHPMNRLGKPEEIAAAVLWLCSDQASFITGYPLAVDGGFVTGRPDSLKPGE